MGGELLETLHAATSGERVMASLCVVEFQHEVRHVDIGPCRKSHTSSFIVFALLLL